jgi:hypothetical protein
MMQYDSPDPFSNLVPAGSWGHRFPESYIASQKEGFLGTKLEVQL